MEPAPNLLGSIISWTGHGQRSFFVRQVQGCDDKQGRWQALCCRRAPLFPPPVRGCPSVRRACQSERKHYASLRR
jgi:hypothetical protein